MLLFHGLIIAAMGNRMVDGEWFFIAGVFCVGSLEAKQRTRSSRRDRMSASFEALQDQLVWPLNRLISSESIVARASLFNLM